MPKLSDYRMTAKGPVLKRRAATKSRALRRPTDPGSARNRSRRRVADKRATRNRELGSAKRGPAKLPAVRKVSPRAAISARQRTVGDVGAGRMRNAAAQLALSKEQAKTSNRSLTSAPGRTGAARLGVGGPKRRPAARRRVASPRTRRRY